MPVKTYDNRIYLRWDEAAEVLGTDREGLRQDLRYRYSPLGRANRDIWLPVLLTTRGEGFLARLWFDLTTKEPAFQWGDRNSFYKHCEHVRALPFADGSEILLRAEAGEDGWEATHNCGTGMHFTFVVSGQTLVASPETVRHACDHDGFVDFLDIAPRDWCADGFPETYFHVIETPGSFYSERPQSLFDAALFLTSDVLRVRQPMTGDRLPVTPRSESAVEKPVRTDARKNMLLVIRALYEKANMKDREAVSDITQMLESLGYRGPSDDTIRSLLKEARRLKPDEEPR